MASIIDRPIRIATRASRLALWQAEFVSQWLQSAQPELVVEIVRVSTVGDQDQSRPLATMGGTGVFTREVQRAVLDDEADIAVHSLKDLPTETAAGLVLAGIPSRGPRFDALVLPAGATGGLDDLPQNARVGTGSLRRRAQLLHHRSDLELMDVRGNVETRLRKLDEGQFSALVLAEAGLERLGFAERISAVLGPPLMLPAVGQAALGIECRADDDDLVGMLALLSDPVTRAEVTVERACLHELRAGCHAPVGVWTRCADSQVTSEAVVLSADGCERIHVVQQTIDATPDEIGRALAALLIEQGAQTLISDAG